MSTKRDLLVVSKRALARGRQISECLSAASAAVEEISQEDFQCREEAEILIERLEAIVQMCQDESSEPEK